MSLAFALTVLMDDKTIELNKLIIEITTNSSIKVNPDTNFLATLYPDELFWLFKQEKVIELFY